MIRNATLSSLLLLAFSSANAQSDCGAGRYTDPLYFDSVSVLSGVVYGANNGVNGQPQTLLLDVYQPVGDTYQDRPVVIVAFGGSFIAGTRTVEQLDQNLAWFSHPIPASFWSDLKTEGLLRQDAPVPA
jgi:hypothetical protein